jgi:DNA-binding transcriptional LysR family regulator
MNLNDLKVFLAVADASGVNRAAPYLGRVASNVSTRVAYLERAFGVTLFVRSNSGMSLTREGEVLRTYAYRLLRTFDETCSALGDKDRPTLLRIGIVPSIGSSEVAHVLATFASNNPKCELELEPGQSQTLRARVLAGELDGAFCHGDEALEGLTCVPVDQEVLILAGGQHWDGEPLRSAIAFGPDCEYRSRLECWYASRNAAPLKFVDAPSLEFLLNCVVSGGSLTVLPAAVLSTHHCAQKLAVRPLPAPLDTLQISFVHPQSKVPKALSSLLHPAATNEKGGTRSSDEIPSHSVPLQVI